MIKRRRIRPGLYDLTRLLDDDHTLLIGYVQRGDHDEPCKEMRWHCHFLNTRYYTDHYEFLREAIKTDKFKWHELVCESAQLLEIPMAGATRDHCTQILHQWAERFDKPWVCAHLKLEDHTLPAGREAMQHRVEEAQEETPLLLSKPTYDV